MSDRRAGHAAIVLADGRVLVAGGSSDAPAELYDPASRSWSPMDSGPGSGASAAVRLIDGSVLFVGGGEQNIFTGEDWLPGPMLVSSRSSPLAATLPDGTVLIAGGRTGSSFLDTAEILSVETGEGRPIASMSRQRHRATATVLVDGRVLVVGGATLIDSEDTTATAEIFDPATETWIPAAPMAQARRSHTATLLQDGRVLVAGGTNSGGSQFESAELYDPETDTWSAGPPMFEGRREHAAVLLPDGRVLVIGGLYLPGGSIGSTEVFDPVGNAWGPGPTLLATRNDFVAVVLADGSVLVIGGEQGEGLTAEAELLPPDEPVE